MTLNEWKEKHRNGRSYAHFDPRVSLDRVWNYISQPKCVATHSFYPFIHFSKKADKYNKLKGEVIPKSRDLCYSAHLDRYIYQYYGYLLNQRYNERVMELGIHNTAIAYRDNFNRKSNIHFAKAAIDFIRDCEKCYIIIGDFTKFFDRLDHKHLKNMLCNLLGVTTLPDDYYTVYKNIIHYCVWELKSILELNGLENSHAGYVELNKKDRALLPETFKANKDNIIQPTKSQGYGIPQGSAISAIFSNIYMLDTDKEINDFVCDAKGIYMRYSDDFIIVLPMQDENQFKAQYKTIDLLIHKTPGLELQPDKTKIFIFEDGSLKNINSRILSGVVDSSNILNYLGFSFDGQVVTIRAKTISKYYYRLYRKAKGIVKSGGITKQGNPISAKNLYLKYSIKGAHPKQKKGGNFLTYVDRAKNVFGNQEEIDKSTKHHMDKIRKQLNKGKS